MSNQFDFASFPVLETERLRLRQIEIADAPQVLEMFSHPEVMQYKSMSVVPELEVAESWIRWIGKKYVEQNALRWGITLKEVDKVIGSVGLRDWDRRVNSVEVGYDLAYVYWNQGMMTEALAAALRFGFEQMQVNRVQAMVVLGNEASLRVLEKLGFQHEGICRDAWFDNEQYQDLHLLSLLRREFMA
ncbi:MAG: GNAT family N-acetyltransferase [Anaerolineales bacterium]|nr:GNAT family N-acetyltransferase [Anaerolineales bacterium]